MQANALALSMGRALQKAQTGFVHFCKESGDLKTHDTIAVYENALFALSLFRSRLSEHVLEGKELIEKLLAFEVEGNFPVYLHEYPTCHDPYLGLRLLPIFFWLTVDFSHVIGSLKEELLALIERILKATAPYDLPIWAKNRIDAMEGMPIPLSSFLDEDLISLQIAEKKGANIEQEICKAAELWHPQLSLYIGPSSQRHQVGFAPEVTLFDLFMSQWQKHFSDRVQMPHPVHLKGALIRPLSFPLVFDQPPSPYIHFDPSEDMPLWMAWNTHTFALAKKNLKVEGEASELILTPEEGEEMGINFYLDYHLDHTFFVDGKKASVFRQGEQLQIQSNGLNLFLSFETEEGVYMGHLMRGNRPSQHMCRGENQHTSYDWRIAIRTISPGSSLIRVQLHWEKVPENRPQLPLHASHCPHTE